MNVLQSLQDAVGQFFGYVPQLIGAIVILIVGYFVAKILQAVVGRILQGIGFDGWMERAGIKRFFDRADTHQTPAGILGRLVFWFVFIIAIVMATDALGIRQVSAVLSQLIAYIPNVIAAVLIIILASLLAIIVYAVFAALTQLGIAVQLTAPTFLIILGAVALAAAIAFGLGARDVAKDIVEKAYYRSYEVTGDSGRGTVAGGTTASGRAGEGGDPTSTAATDRRYEEGHELVKM